MLYIHYTYKVGSKTSDTGPVPWKEHCTVMWILQVQKIIYVSQYSEFDHLIIISTRVAPVFCDHWYTCIFWFNQWPETWVYGYEQESKINFREKKEVAGSQIRRVWGLGSDDCVETHAFPKQAHCHVREPSCQCITIQVFAMNILPIPLHIAVVLRNSHSNPRDNITLHNPANVKDNHQHALGCVPGVSGFLSLRPAGSLGSFTMKTTVWTLGHSHRHNSTLQWRHEVWVIPGLLIKIHADFNTMLLCSALLVLSRKSFVSFWWHLIHVFDITSEHLNWTHSFNNGSSFFSVLNINLGHILHTIPLV